MKRPVAAVVFLACTVVIVLGFFTGPKIKFSDQWPLFEALRTTASIIFAVVGAWFAIIYPERLRGTFRKSDESQEPSPAMRKLFTPIVHSTLILSIVLMVGVLAPMMKTTNFAKTNHALMLGLSFALLCALTCWQVVTVLMTLSPADSMKQKVDLDQRRQDALDAFRGP